MFRRVFHPIETLEHFDRKNGLLPVSTPRYRFFILGSSARSAQPVNTRRPLVPKVVNGNFPA